jgi:hypothetical protein
MWNYLKWARTPLRRRLGVRFVVDREPRHERTVFLAGTARSGTTWVSEIINHHNDYRYIFEPFYPKRVPEMAPFGSRPYLRPGDHRPDLLRLAERVVTGRLHSPWTERFNRRFMADRRLVKDVRANLMLGWLKHHFPRMPMVLVIRHPCAVAHSYAKHGWPGSVDALLEQPALVEDLLGPNLDVIAGTRDAYERAVVIWCVETRVALGQLTPAQLHVVFYELLIKQPKDEIHQLFGALGMPFEQGVVAATARPSRTTRRDSAIATGEDPATSWFSRVDPLRRRRTREIVERFGLDELYGDGAVPDPVALEGLFGTLRNPGLAEEPGVRDAERPQ